MAISAGNTPVETLSFIPFERIHHASGEKDPNRLVSEALSDAYSSPARRWNRSAPSYQPAKWNAHKSSANCYVYAANDFNPKYTNTSTDMDPGHPPPFFGANIYSTDPKELQKFTNVIKAGAESDGMHWTGNKSQPAPGHYKVALFVKPANGGPDDGDVMDYHWLRQDNNGSWSQKRGPLEVTNRDSKGKLITDPEKASIQGYKFVGYFDVPAGGINLKR